jgi:hypothetical protein
MSIPHERAPSGESALSESAFPGGNCSSELSQKAHVAQAKLELLDDDLGCNISAMIATLEAALAMRAADNRTGLIYGLRCSRAYWRAISLSAAELVAADAERLSALRQGEPGR